MNFQTPIISKLAGGAMAVALATLGLMPVIGQQSSEIGMPVDWSFRHVVFTSPYTPEMAVAANRDPRVVYNWLQRQRGRQLKPVTSRAAGSAGGAQAKPGGPAGMKIDWAFSLGNGRVAPNMSPAKFSFSTGPITAANCTSDFAVFALDVAGAATQANLVGIQNLYSGASPTGLCGTAPTIKFAYNVSTAAGGILTSPVLSIDGTKVAFVESAASGGTSAILHVLTIGSSGNNGASATSAVPPAGGVPVNNASMVNLTYGAAGNTNSSPYVDYGNDILYVGNDAGVLFKFTGVFRGTPTAAGSSTVAAGVKLTAPVVDTFAATPTVFIGGGNGLLYARVASTLAAQAPSGSLAVGDGSTFGGIVDPPILDVTNAKVYATSGCNTAVTLPPSNSAQHAVLVQAPESLPAAGTSGATSQFVAVGQNNQSGGSCPGGINLHSPIFDDAYYTSIDSGHIVVCGASRGGSGVSGNHNFPVLYRFGFTSGRLNADLSALDGGLEAAPGSTSVQDDNECSPLTELLNSGVDRLFLGVGKAGLGFIRSFSLTTTPITLLNSQTAPNALGGTSAIVIDNVSTADQASSIYFSTLANGSVAGGTCGTNVKCAVKLTQSALQ